jgi:hypothetical protein
VDAYVVEYNTDRPHQALDVAVPVTPAERFRPAPIEDRELVELWLPGSLQAAPGNASPESLSNAVTESAEVASAVTWAGGPVEFDKVVPPSGNLQVAGRQFWLGPHRAGQMVRFWADVDLIHLLVAGARIKTVRSYLSVNDLARFVADGAINAGSSPLPQVDGTDDLATRELLRVRPNPMPIDQARRLRGARPAGPPPRPSADRSTCNVKPATPA